MKKIVSAALVLMTCLMLTVPAAAATNSVYVVAPQTAYGYAAGPWTWGGNYWNGTYWNGNSYIIRPWNGDYRYVGPSGNYWANSVQGMNHFQRTRTYVSGTYKDVPAGAWYETGVKTLYEMGILTAEARFRPAGTMTLQEVVSLAVRLHSTYNGWSVPAEMTELQYALNVGIVEYGQYDNYNAIASRRSFAAIMAKALPSEALRGINVIMDGAIPDVPVSAAGAEGIYTLYRAGVLVGSDPWGTFYPNDQITRASAAVITARMVDASQREGVSLLTAEVYGISLDRTTLGMYPGQARTLTAYINPLNAVNRSVRWASSDYSVATVDAYGVVSALRPGTAIITATTANGLMASCVVNVANGF